MMRSRKVWFLAFMVVFLPIYGTKYGMRNFLYFCDAALLVTLIGILSLNTDIERTLLSAALTGILFPQVIWCVDFIQGFLGLPYLTGISQYMFNHKLPLYLRFLSFFHFWLPWFLLYSLSQIGFDRNGWIVWSIITALDLIIAYWASPPAGGPPELPRNINKVFGLDDEKPQTQYHPYVWLIFLIVVGPVCVYYPTAVVVEALFERYGF